jgi:hypothetical protein
MKRAVLTIKDFQILPTGVRLPIYAFFEDDLCNRDVEVADWQDCLIRLEYHIDDDIPANAKCGDVITIDDYRLRLVEFNPPWNDPIYVMADGWKALLYWRWRQTTYIARWINVRLIVTARVWGLAKADGPVNVVTPSWSELRVLQRLNQRRRGRSVRK